jgi:DNA-directed RNA polymerase specialized sigma24 family protein
MPEQATPNSAADAQFTALYREYRPRVQGYIRGRLKIYDPQLAEDLTADVFTSLWRSHYKPGRPVEERVWGLLSTIAARRIVDHYRPKRNTMERPFDTGHWTFASRELVPAGAGTLKPLVFDSPLASLRMPEGERWNREAIPSCAIRATSVATYVAGATCSD